MCNDRTGYDNFVRLYYQLPPNNNETLFRSTLVFSEIYYHHHEAEASMAAPKTFLGGDRRAMTYTVEI